MATTHVFIVDSNTFKYHLEYQFVGTGGKDYKIDFNNNSDTSLHYNIENTLVGMIADFQRLRKNDFVIFYVQKEKKKEGKFFGIFQIKEDYCFLDNNNGGQFLKNELIKSLTFRSLIKPFEVYAEGVTEWEALDTIKGMCSPNQMLWSLIYRKLKATRGNTMVTIYESERLFKLLRDINTRQTVESNHFSYDVDNQTIIPDLIAHPYVGRRETINVLPRLIKKYISRRVFEGHLQAYIVENIGRNTNQSLDENLLSRLPIEWIGNEVYCGVGLQRIDVMLSLVKDNARLIVPMELKATVADQTNTSQIQRYVDWLEQYYIPNRISDIQPVLISKKIETKDSISYKEIVNAFNNFNSRNQKCLPLKFIEYHLIDSKIIFEQIKY
jgi:hypothetical protein